MAATIDAETRRKANLRVLQRIDRNIVDLAITATHVVLYEYSKNNCWEKMNVEGTLFVTKRSDVPRFKLIVLNRSSTENMEVPITASFQMQVKDPYLIFRESSLSNDFRGFWFHDGEERDRIASHLEQVVKSLIQLEEIEKKNYSHASPLTPPPPSVGEVVDAEAVRRDAGAALLSTLNLGGKADNISHVAAVTVGVPLTSEPNSALPTSSTPPRTAAATAVATTTSAGMKPISSSIHTIGVSSSSFSHPSSTQHHLVLDKKNLQLTLLSLLHDERFLDLIHAQYLKVVQRRQAASAPREEEDGGGRGFGGK